MWLWPFCRAGGQHSSHPGRRNLLLSHVTHAERQQQKGEIAACGWLGTYVSRGLRLCTAIVSLAMFVSTSHLTSAQPTFPLALSVANCCHCCCLRRRLLAVAV
jgi:hypothetical protein